MGQETELKQKLFKLSKELKLRIISSVILIPVVLGAVIFSEVLFYCLIIVMAVLMSFEWKNLISSEGFDEDTKRWDIIGVLYVAIPCVSLLWLRSLNEDDYGASGVNIILWIFLLVWGVDIAAYFFGKNIGGKKLIPSISPNKTWAGLLGGIIAAVVVSFITSISLKVPSMLLFVLVGSLLAIIEQAGDIFESWVKRQFDKKDSGGIIPGHGGILDRVDGLVVVAPVVALILLVTSGNGIFK